MQERLDDLLLNVLQHSGEGKSRRLHQLNRLAAFDQVVREIRLLRRVHERSKDWVPRRIRLRALDRQLGRSVPRAREHGGNGPGGSSHHAPVLMPGIGKYLESAGKRHSFGAAAFKHKIIKCHISVPVLGKWSRIRVKTL